MPSTTRHQPSFLDYSKLTDGYRCQNYVTGSCNKFLCSHHIGVYFEIGHQKLHVREFRRLEVHCGKLPQCLVGPPVDVNLNGPWHEAVHGQHIHTARRLDSNWRPFSHVADHWPHRFLAEHWTSAGSVDMHMSFLFTRTTRKTSMKICDLGPSKKKCTQW